MIPVLQRSHTGHRGVNPAIIKSRNAYEEQVAYESMCALGEDWWAWVIESTYRCEDKAVKARMREMEMTRIAQSVAAVEQRIHPVLEEPDYKVSRDIMKDWAYKFRDRNDNLDYSCWDDEEFIRDMKRDNPEMRVNVAKSGNRVGWTPEMDRPGLVLTDKRGQVEDPPARRPLPRTSLPASRPLRRPMPKAE